ncbi:MAG: hypothetical protein K2Q10_01065 [Rhodospirillales bacterium]|nr:hypothetical protein [Rhodospirillales bacterium]
MTTECRAGKLPTLKIFYSIPQTGGSTVRCFLEDYYKNDNSLVKDYQGEKHLDGLIDTLVLHNPSPVHKLTARPCRYVTLLREPIAANISEYFWIRTCKNTHLSFEEYFDIMPDCYNPFCRWLISLEDDTPFWGAPVNPHFLFTPEHYKKRLDEDELVRRAEAIIAKHFDFVGISEHFSDSLFIMAVYFYGWDSLPVWVRTNPSARPMGWRDEQISPAIKDKIARACRADILLYRRCLAAFEPLARSVARKFGGLLDEYREMCDQRDAAEAQIRQLKLEIGVEKGSEIYHWTDMVGRDRQDPGLVLPARPA